MSLFNYLKKKFNLLTYPELKSIKVEPIGLPINRVGDFSPGWEVNEDFLNNILKKEWIGEVVKKGDLLIDFKIVKNFCYRVVETVPDKEGVISEKTKIQSIEKNLVEIKIEKDLEEKEVTTNEVITSEDIISEEVDSLAIKKYSFKDIIGQNEAKEKCKIIIKYLEDPSKFGKWAPKNVLFYGPSGTGKTMMALALANECESDVSVFLKKATDLMSRYIGESADEIHLLYDQARAESPSIVYIDEFDAIALDRKYQDLRGDVIETVNALLSEMDGINDNEGVVTICSTNNIHLLDKAILSRFEEKIEFKLPNTLERMLIIKNLLKESPIKVELSNNELKYLSKITEGLSGRDLTQSLVKPVIQKAIISEKNEIVFEDFRKRLEKLGLKEKEKQKQQYDVSII